MRDRAAVLMVLGAAMLWGTTGTARALAPEEASPLAVGALRILVGGAVLVAVALVRRTLLAPWPVVAVVMAAAGVAAYQIAFFEGVARAGVAVGTIVAIGSAPLFAGVIGASILGESLTARWMVATVVGVVGVILLSFPRERVALDALAVLLPLGAGLAYAVYAAASKRLLGSHDSVAVAAVAFGGGALLLLPFLFAADLAWVWRPAGLAVVLELGVVATALAYVLYTRGLARLPVSRAATLSLAEPLTATLLGVLVLRESLAPVQLAGAVAVGVGLAVLAARPRS